MAKIEWGNKNKRKKYLTLEDCEVGDIVLLNEEIYIITDGAGYSTTFILVNLKTGEQEEFDYDIVCARYEKSLLFDMSDFQEYGYAD